MADYLLDTGVLVRCLRGIKDTLELGQHLLTEGDLHVAALSTMEVLALAAPPEERRTREFLTPFFSLPMDQDIASRAAQILQLVAGKKPEWSFPDAIIAATALEHELTLVTYQKQFSTLADLKLYKLPDRK
jgi:predicted nucleic acid-binding protein